MARLPVSQAKEKIKQKKIKRAFKVARFRGLKNFMFWLAGALSSFAIFFGAVFIAVKVVPISTYVGGKDKYAEYVSDKVAYKSILDAILEIQSYKFEDFPIVEKSINDLLENTKIDEHTKLGDVITVDTVKLNSIQFKGDFSSALSECIAFNEDGINNKVLGSENAIAVFRDYIQVPSPLNEEGTDIKEGLNPKIYCYKSAQGNAPMSTGEFLDLVDENGNIKQSIPEDAEFYIKPMLKLPIMDAISNVGAYINYLGINEVLNVLKMDRKSLVYKAFRDVKLGAFISSEGGFSADMILKNICLNDLEEFTSLGDIGKLEFFRDYSLVEEQDRPEVVGDRITENPEGSEDKFTSNPKLYYLLVEGNHGEETAVYARAFNDDGQFLSHFYKQEDGSYIGDTKGDNPDKLFEDFDKADLYYANLTYAPFADVLDLLGETIGRQTIPGLMKAFEIDLGENELISKLLGDYTIADFGKSEEDGGFSVDTLLSRVSLVDLGGAELLGDLGNLSFFKGYSLVEKEDKPVIDGGYITKGKDIDDQETFTSNPKLYYILVGSEYVRAFDDDGKLLDTITDYDNTELYYANLTYTPFSDALDLLGETIGIQTIPGLMEALGIKVEEGSLIEKLLKGYTIEEFGKPVEEGGFDVNKVVITDLLGEKDDSNETLYKLLLSATVGMPEKGSMTDLEYQQAIDDAIKALTIGNLMGDFNIEGVSITQFIALDGEVLDMLVESINVNKKAEHDAITDPDKGEYQPVTKDNVTIGDFKYFGLDGVKLSTILGDYATSQTLYDVLLSAKGLMPEKGSMSNDEYLNAKKELAENLTADVLSSGLNIEDVSLSVILTNDDGENDELYNILLQALTITGVSNPTYEDIKISHLQSGFKLDNVSLSTVLGDYSDNQTLYNVLLSAKDLMPEKGSMTDTEYKTAKETAAKTLNVGSLSEGFDMMNVNLSVVLENNATNKSLYDILLKAVVVTDGNDNVIASPSVNDIKIKHLSSFKADNILLSSVITPSSNTELYDILVQTINDVRKAEYDANTATDKGEFVATTSANVTVGDFKYFKTNKILLSSVLENNSDNATIYKLLTEATGLPVDKITVESLNGFKTDNVHLVSVMPYSADNADLYKILCQATNTADYNAITVATLKDFSVGNVNMGTALPGANDTLKSILVQALGGTKDYEDILISELGSADFSISKVKLKNVLTGVPDDGLLAQILSQATGTATTAKPFEDITIEDLSGSSFTLDNVQLATVLHENTDDNPILNALLHADGDPVTVGTLSERIGSLTVYSVYGESVFTTVQSKAVYDLAYYMTFEDGKHVGYTTNAEDARVKDTTKYYLSTDSGMWGLVCLDAKTLIYSGANAGRASEYVICTLTVKDMENGASISDKLKNATLRRMIDAGVLDGSAVKSTYYCATMSEILTHLP